MVPLVAFPEIVERYAPHFAGVFSDEALVQFKRYISGLIVSENKTVDGINRLFVHESRNQSSLNRLLTESPFSLPKLNESRLAVLGSVPGTQIKDKGVLSIDDTLLSHYGQHFEQIAKLYDPTQERYVWAHNLVTLHDSDDQTDYPVLFELWRPAALAAIEQGLEAANIKLKESKQALKESDPAKWRQYLLGVWRRNQKKPEVAALYESKLRMAERHCQQWVETHPNLKLPVAFDSWYTQPGFCHFLDKLGLAYVGALAGNEELLLKTGKERLDAFAARLKKEHQAAVEAGQPPLFQRIQIQFKGVTETYYTYCRSHRIAHFGKVRLVISHRKADLSDNSIYLSSNRLVWQAKAWCAFIAIAGPLKCIMKKAKPKGWISIKCGTLRLLNDMSP